MKKANPFLSGVRYSFIRRRQRGASLLEGIAYLGIAAIVVLGAVSLLTNAFGNAKANQMTEEVIAMRTAVRKMYAGQPYNNGNMQRALFTANAFPNTLVRTGGNANTVNNSWAGTVTVAGPNAGNFTITYTNVPQDVCMSVVSGANGWSAISNANGANSFNVFPASVDNARNVCTAATNTLVFTAT